MGFVGWIENFAFWGPLGFLASFLGATATIYFSLNAAKSADGAEKAAQDAATQAKKMLILSDTTGELQKLENLMTSLKLETDNKGWPKCAQICTDSYSIASRSIERIGLDWPHEKKQLLEKIKTQSLKLEGEYRKAFEKKELTSPHEIQTLITSLKGDCLNVMEHVKGLSFVK